MKRSVFKKLGCTVCGAVAAVSCCFGTAYAYNEIYESYVTTWDLNPTYQTFNSGAYTMYDYYNADVNSTMYVRNTTGDAPAGSMISRAAFTIFTNDAIPGSHDAWEYAINASGTVQNRYLICSYDRSICTYDLESGLGENGATAWGLGGLGRSPSTMGQIT